MVRVHECYMCGSKVYPGHGSMYVRNDAKVFRYCSSKCTKLASRRQNPRRLKHSKHHRRAVGKELVMDSTFDFEKRRNRPVKYDRELYAQTISAMKTIEKIQDKRKRDFYDDRMKKSMKMRKQLVASNIKKNMDLIIHPVVAKRIAEQHLKTPETTRQELQEKIRENPMVIINTHKKEQEAKKKRVDNMIEED